MYFCTGTSQSRAIYYPISGYRPSGSVSYGGGKQGLNTIMRLEYFVQLCKMLKHVSTRLQDVEEAIESIVAMTADNYKCGEAFCRLNVLSCSSEPLTFN